MRGEEEEVKMMTGDDEEERDRREEKVKERGKDSRMEALIHCILREKGQQESQARNSFSQMITVFELEYKGPIQWFSMLYPITIKSCIL